ncbi:MAG TPA: SfnB family sulfur acquisition oxidoreductase, partial [Acidimicrobiales bacterium]|nr:SfnB family sulfur acquisition oxidoreductase [Acidimicrobiales bacterium]
MTATSIIIVERLTPVTSALDDVRDTGSRSSTKLAVVDPNGVRVIAAAEEAVAVARQLAAGFQESAAQRDLERRLPIEEVDLLSRQGLYSLTVPSWIGGPDLPPSVVADVLRILATADPNIAQIPHSHYVYVNLLRQAGVGNQQEALLSQVLAGARFGNAQSEANSPTIDKIRTLIEPDGDDFVVNGDKFYCTGAYFAHVIPVLAKNADGRAFVAFVPRETEGLSIVDDWAGMGQRTTASGTVHFVDVKVPPWRVVARDPLFAGPQVFGAFAQLLHTAIDAGIARGALNEAVAFVQTKSRPWFEAGVERAADDALLIQRIGELTVDVRTAEAVCREAGEALDAAELERANGRLSERLAAETSIAVATAKVVADRVGVQTASALFEVCGTRSAAESLDLSRHWRNVRTHTLHDPVRWKL